MPTIEQLSDFRLAAPRETARQKQKIPRQRRFSLADNMILEGTCCSSRVWIDIRREHDGRWTFLVKDEEDEWFEYDLMSPEEIREEVENYDLGITDEEWWEMGWRPTVPRLVG